MRCCTWVIALLLGLAGAGALAADEAISGCEARDGLEPICVVHGPEDLEVLPGGKQLVVSQSRVEFDASGRMNWKPGSLGLLDLATRKLRVLYPPGRRSPGPGGWGDASCAREIGADISPHGIHLAMRTDGKRQLLVVNHGARESVEMFELRGAGRRVQLGWRGCALAPAHTFLNDTVALADGSFLVTMMMDDSVPLARHREKAEHGENTGYVLRWRRASGFEPVAGTESPLPNGIQASTDGALLFVDVNGASGEVRKYDLASGKLLGAARVPNPDNASWASDGRLLVAGVQPGATFAHCQSNFVQPCGAAFNVFAIDPVSLDIQLLLAHEGPPMGFATVAVQAADALYIGSAAGDRILRAPIPRPGPRPPP